MGQDRKRHRNAPKIRSVASLRLSVAHRQINTNLSHSLARVRGEYLLYIFITRYFLVNCVCRPLRENDTQIKGALRENDTHAILWLYFLQKHKI